MIKILISTLILSIVFNTSSIADEEVEKNEISTEKKQIKEAKDETTLEEFVPSEEISIDKPVAFPVDI